MNVAVVIPTFNRPDLLAKCCEALKANTPAHTRLIVDNGFIGPPTTRTPGTSGHVWTAEGRNLGFAAGCNHGAALAPDADVFVFLNDDTEVQPGWLEPLVAAAAPISGSHLVYPDGRTQHAGVTVNVEAGTLVARNITHPQPSGPVDAVTGACLAVDAEWFRANGGFDEGYWNGYEDVDLCLRAGGATFVAESVVVHHESQSGPQRWTRVRENVTRLNERWNK